MNKDNNVLPSPVTMTAKNLQIESMTACGDKSIEETAKGILNPNNNDVLCGKGGNYQRKNGSKNREYREIVDKYAGKFNNTKKNKEKQYITDEIIAEVEDSGGRFLQQDETTKLWHEIRKDEAKTKVKQALRDTRKKNCIQKPQQLTVDKNCLPVDEGLIRQTSEDWKVCHDRNDPPELGRDLIGNVFDSETEKRFMDANMPPLPKRRKNI